MRRFRHLGLAAALPFVVVEAALPGCGGARDSGLFGAPGGGDDTAADGGERDARGSSDAETGNGGNEAGSGHDGGGRDDAGAFDSGGENGDANDEIKVLPCGQGPNCSTAEGCCVTYPLVGSPSFQCGQGSFGGCTPLVTCHSKDDCTNGEVCCGTLTFGTVRYNNVHCATSCDVSSASNIRFCDEGADDDECAEINLHCGASTVLTGYGRCGN